MVTNYLLPLLLAILITILASSTFAAPYFSSSKKPNPLVETPYGQYKPNVVDKQHHFFAIPYAQPPINELRFRAPQPLLTQLERDKRDEERAAYNKIFEYNGRHYMNDKVKEKSVLGNDTPVLMLGTRKNLMQNGTSVVEKGKIGSNVFPHPSAGKRIETLKKFATNMASIENIPLSSTTTSVANIVGSASQTTTLLGNMWEDDSDSESEASSAPSMPTPSVKIKFIESATSQSPNQLGFSQSVQTLLAGETLKETQYLAPKPVPKILDKAQNQSLHPVYPNTHQHHNYKRSIPEVNFFHTQPFLPEQLPSEKIIFANPESRHVHRAHTFGPACPQPLDLKSPIGWRESEDCLTLNIFRPAVSDYRFKSEESLLPVMVFIHGGDMVSGGAMQYPLEQFVKVASEENNPVLAVSIQYRLGLLGFLDIEELDQKEKNLGFLDQRLALNWIKANIHHFGGDPRRVTLMGHDSGAMSVLTHLLWNPDSRSYISKNLFHRAVPLSLSLPPPVSVKSPYHNILKRLNCTDANAMRFLRELPFATLQSVMNYTLSIPPTTPSSLIESGILEAHPYDLVKSSRFRQVPLITGYIDSSADTAFMDTVSRRVGKDIDINKITDIQLLQILYPTGDSNMTLLKDLKSTVVRRAVVKNWVTKAFDMYKGVWSYRLDESKVSEVNNEQDLLNFLYLEGRNDDKLAYEMASRLAAFVANGTPNTADMKTWPRYKYGANEARVSGLQIVFSRGSAGHIEVDDAKEEENTILTGVYSALVKMLGLGRECGGEN